MKLRNCNKSHVTSGIIIPIILGIVLLVLYETTKPYPRVVLHELGELMTQMQQKFNYLFDIEPQDTEGFLSYGKHPILLRETRVFC